MDFMNPEVIIPGVGEEVDESQRENLGCDCLETIRKEYYELRGWGKWVRSAKGGNP